MAALKPHRSCRRQAVVLAAMIAAAPGATAELAVQPGESIAAAIAQASPGDVITIARGRYEENVLIDKPLTLRGLGRPTLSGALMGDTIRVASPDVTLANLIVSDSGDDLTSQNAGIYIQPGAHRATVMNCVVSYSLFGIWIEDASDVRISGNLITGKRDYPSAQRGNGIQLHNTSGASISGNHISFVRDGIYVSWSHDAVFRNNRIHDTRYGTHYMNSHNNVLEGNEVYRNRGGLALMSSRDLRVRNNRVWNNSDQGIMLRTIQDSIIENNVVSSNQRGFFIYDAEFNILRNNRVMENDVGVHLTAGSIHNQVDGNDFVRNREQIRYVAARDEQWGAEGGNHWSNYVGWDRDGDGRGDVPYEANDVVDRLVWRIPAVKLLMNSPALQALRLVAQQFPLLRAPSIVDPKPRMQPTHANWSEPSGKDRH